MLNSMLNRDYTGLVYLCRAAYCQKGLGTNFGNFFIQRESRPWNKRYLSLGILFLAYQQQTLKIIGAYMTLNATEWTDLIFLLRIFQTRTFDDSPIEIYIFFTGSLISCCPSNCCLCLFSSNIPFENIGLILCWNISIFFLSGLVRKVGIEMEIKNPASLLLGYLSFGAELGESWLLLQQLKNTEHLFT